MSSVEKTNFFMKEEGRRLIKVGLFLVAAIVSVIVLVSILGRARSLFSNKVHLYVYFDDVKGLAQGAPVRLSGREIGVVQRIDYISEAQALKDHAACVPILSGKDAGQQKKHAFFNELTPEQRVKVRVDFNIPKNYLPKVSTESIVQLTSKGLLGDGILNIVPGALPGTKKDVTQISDGTCLISVDDDLVNTVQQAIGKVETLVGHVDERLQALLTDELGRNLNRLLGNTATLMERAQKGPGFLHDLLFDPGLAKDARRLINQGQQAVGDFDVALRQLTGVLAGVKKGVQQLTDEQRLPKLLDQMTRAAGNIADVVDQLRPLVTDKKIAQILTDASESMKMVRGIVGQVNHGKGDIRKLISDLSEAAAKLNGILGAANENPLIKGFIRTLK